MADVTANIFRPLDVAWVNMLVSKLMNNVVLFLPFLSIKVILIIWVLYIHFC